MGGGGGSGPEWYISSMLYSQDISFWSGTLEMVVRRHRGGRGSHSGARHDRGGTGDSTRAIGGMVVVVMTLAQVTND